MNEQVGSLYSPPSSKEQLKLIEEYCKTHKPKNNKHSDTRIAFGISLKSKTVSLDWAKVGDNLANTLRSIFRNTDQNFQIVVAGHEKPKIKELQHERVTWLPVDFPPAVDSRGYSSDRKLKRGVIGAYLRKVGFSGYFMPLDADDWIHYRFVQFIRSFPLSDAFIFNRGFMINQGLNELWLRERFFRGCGSSAVIYFNNNDFPISPKIEDVSKSLFKIVNKSHVRVDDNLSEIKKNYIWVNFPLITYVFGHGDNWMVMEGRKDNSLSAKDFKANREKIRSWFYDSFKINSV